MSLNVPWTMNPDEIVEYSRQLDYGLLAVRTLTGVKVYEIESGWVYEATPESEYETVWHVRAWKISDVPMQSSFDRIWIEYTPADVEAFVFAAEVFIADNPQPIITEDIRRQLVGGTWMFAEQAPEFVLRAILAVSKDTTTGTSHAPPSHPRFR